MNSSSPWIIACSLQIYRWLLQLGPTEFRDEYSEPTLQLFRQCCRDAYQRQGTWGVMRLWFPLFSEAATGMLAEYNATQRLLLWPVLTALILLLFPFYWLSAVCPAFGLAFHSIFATMLAHQIGRIILFYIVALLTLGSFPRLRHHPILYILLMLLGGATLQSFVKLHLPSLSDSGTLLFNLTGIVMAYLIVQLWHRFHGTPKKRNKISYQEYS